MSAIVQYRPLCNVEILLDYYLSEEASLSEDLDDDVVEALQTVQNRNYRVHRELSINPTEDCKKVLKNNRLIHKPTNNGFLIATQVSRQNNNFVPFIALNEPIRLRFAMQIRNPYFLNYCNLRLEKDIDNRDRSIYYFSNRAGNVSDIPNTDNILSLSRSIPSYEANYNYEAGEVINATLNANTVLLEAIEDTNINPTDQLDGNGNLVPNASWRQIFEETNPLPQFVTALDKLSFRPATFHHNVEAANLENLQIIIRNRIQTIVYQEIFRTSEAGTPLRSCPINLDHLSPDSYTLEVQTLDGNSLPDLGLSFYMDNILFNQKTFAIIELFHEPNDSLGAYNWLTTNTNLLLSPTYSLRWKNRSTWWRYYYAADTTVPNESDVRLFSSDTQTFNNILVSEEPLALTQRFRNVDLGAVHLPNPGIRSIFPENGRIYSEINMGGGLGPPPFA